MSIDEQQAKQYQEAVSRAWREASAAENLEPPAALDDAIRAAARRAVKAGPAPAGKSWLARWTPQLAVAATVVLTVSVVFVAIEEKPELAPASVTSTVAKISGNQPGESAARADAASPSASLPESKPPMEAVVATPPVVPQPARVVPSADVQVASGLTAGPKAGPAASQKEKKLEKSLARSDLQTEVPTAADTGAATPAPPKPRAQSTAQAAKPSVTQSATVAPPAIAPPPPANLPAAPGKVQEPAVESARATSKITVGGAVRPESPARDSLARQNASLAAAPTTAAASGAGAASAPSVAGGIAAKESYETRATEPAGIRSLADSAMQKRAEKADDELPGPWIKRMTELRQQGKLKELREELVRFKKRYPAIALPKELTELPAE